MQLSEHFTLEEMCASQVASRRGLDNTPGLFAIENLKRTAAAMEQVRSILSKPVHVDSGYRSPLVNASVGGVPTSAHVDGRACDFVCPEFGTPYDVAAAIVFFNHHIPNKAVAFDQLILEFGWIHLGIADEGVTPRHETLTKRSADAPYEHGINK